MKEPLTAEPDILELSDDLRRLVDVAEERGSVLQSELNDALEPLGLDPQEIEALRHELETRAIDLVDDTTADARAASRRRRRWRSARRRRRTRSSCSCARPADIHC